ncbi:PAS domain S-box protein [Bradyrhizobium sp. ARR65]|uniref:PAS domain S-box protein n=1 Tax=Bradyrhizobium sp. ARR65 TaxID=1040989 RepID=UPI000464515F|nr:PAS domain S-box protein [Bradyrhizobium sp. ARR65]
MVGIIGLALLTALCFWLDFRVGSTALIYLLLIVLLSLAGGFISLIALSCIAVLCLNYLFVPPIFSFRIEYLDDTIRLAAFLITSLVITGLVARLRSRRDELTDILDGLSVLVWTTSSDGSADFSNQRFRDYTGLSRDKLVGFGWMNALQPEDSGAEEWRAALAAGTPIEKEVRIRSATGEYRWFLLRMRPLLNTRGRISKWFGTAGDIEERRRALEALRESEEQWRAVFEHNPTMYFMIDAAGLVVSVNPHGAAQLGYSAGELLGRPVLDVFDEADRPAVERNVAICLERLGQSMSWEARKRRKDGTILWVRETGRATLIKDRPVILVACEDVTDRKRAEYLAGRVFETLPDTVAIVGTDYRYRRANAAHERVWGVPAEKMVGMHVADVLGRELFERLAKPYLDRCFAGERVTLAEWFDTPVGRLYGAVTHSPLRLESERVEAALVLGRDITDQMLASERLREAQAELAHANRVATIGQLTASIAHEVNQPVGALVTNAHAALRLLRAQPADLERTTEALEDIIKDGRRISEVIDRTRALVKKQPTEWNPLDINEVVTETLALTRGELQKQGVSLETKLAVALPLTRGDRIQLQQVIMNLVMNAVEVMSTIEGERKLLIGTAKGQEDTILITVRDSGPIVNSDSLDRFFEPFYSTKPNGMGIGLSICRSIVEAHGGRIWAAANEPCGAALHLILPSLQPSAR